MLRWEGHLPDDLAVFMLGVLLHPGIIDTCTSYAFVAVQQLIDLRDICHIGRRAHRAMREVRFVIRADIGVRRMNQRCR